MSDKAKVPDNRDAALEAAEQALQFVSMSCAACVGNYIIPREAIEKVDAAITLIKEARND